MPNSRYNVIIGRDVLKQGFVFNHAQNTVTWDGLTISMTVATQKPSSITTSFTCAHAAAEVYTNAETTILHAKYDKSSPQEVVDKCMHLNDTNRASLFQLLSKLSRLFSDSLGQYVHKKFSIQLKDPNSPPIFCTPYSEILNGWIYMKMPFFELNN